jgi:NCAIR mutase (PurE)-related protein
MLLDKVARGEMAAATAAAEIEEGGAPAVDGAVIDLAREARTGVPEVVLGEWKTAEQVAAIMTAMATAGRGALATRIAADKAVGVRAVAPLV